MTQRRVFLSGLAAAGIGLKTGLTPTGSATAKRVTRLRNGGVARSERPLRILILGGTSFLGPAEVEYAMARGHTLTLFNRGRTNPHLFPEVEKLVGDRAIPDYTALEGREWDAVIDNSANVAKWVQEAVGILRDTAGRYLFVSSISAHKDNSIVGQDESGPVFTRDDYEEVIESDADLGTAFGPNKAQAERDTFSAFGNRGIVVRPGLIVGPNDRSHRFTYWPVRIDRGGEVLAPGNGKDLTQIVDVRDLGAFLVKLVEDEANGTFLATGPEAPMTMAEMLYGIRAITSTPVSFTWVSSQFLQQHDVGGWMEMPCWVHPSEEMKGFSAYDCSKAIAAGLEFRPLADTARDTLDWYETLPAERKTMRTGIAPDKEARVLEAWNARGG